MSGIVGVLSVRGEPADRPLLQALTQQMAFRGPDAQHTWVDTSVGLGHALLSTTPESARERQPLSLDGKVWIVADARLDARGELVSKLLSARQACPEGAGDAELLLRAYAAWGEASLDHLLGDFCFAIWDGNRKSLFCAHDQLGVKPFFYAESERWLVFSNTLDCVRQAAGGASLNELSVADFLLFGSIRDASGTIFSDVHRLPPAHALTWCDGRLSVKRYWTLPADEEIHYKRSGEYVERFRDLLQVAVKDRLRTDRAAIALSGGLDSTSVAVAARQAGIQHLYGFTVVYDKVIPDDERHYSGLSAESLDIPVQYFVGDLYVTARPRDFPRVRYPQPDESVLAPLEAEFHKLASSRSRVLLSGEGGDLGLSLSNSHFRRLLQAGRYGRFLRDSAAYAIARHGLPPMGVRTLLKRRFGMCDPWRVDYPQWLNPDFEARWQLRERWSSNNEAPSTTHPHRPEAAGELLAPLWQNFLESYDAGYTRASVEVVYPYCDLRLLRFLFSIPPVPWTVDKCLTRTALRGWVPEAVRLRPKTPLAVDPNLVYVRNNWDTFSQAPANVGAYLDLRKYGAFLKSPAAFSESNCQFTVRPVMLSAWLNTAAV